MAPGNEEKSQLFLLASPPAPLVWLLGTLEFQVLPRHGSMQTGKDRSLLGRGREKSPQASEEIARGGQAFQRGPSAATDRIAGLYR